MITRDADAEARAAIAHALDDTLIVEAAAGTGKTTELVKRITRVLATGRARMVEIVAVTFTEKAAGELKLRLRESLEAERAAASDGDVRVRLEDALATLEEAHVDTIHGFCADLLRERPVEARVDPLFVVLTEPQADRLYSRAFRAWFQDVLGDPPEGVRRALRRTSAIAFQDGGGDGPVDRLQKAGRTLAEWRDFPQPWRRPPLDRAGRLHALLDALHRLADLTATPSSSRDNLHVDTDAVRRLSRQIRLEQSFEPPRGPMSGRDLDGWEARLIDLLHDRAFSRPRKGSGARFGRMDGRDVSRAEVLAARDRLFADIQAFGVDADADLAACLQQELAGATERYQALKSTAGALDFADLLVRARDLIRTNEPVRRHLQATFRSIFVDEFQDTDPLQADILLLLASGDPQVSQSEEVRVAPGKLFMVGDPKQSIYRFRGTDVGIYRRVSRLLAARGARILQLTTSYRSVPAIQRFVNAAFRQEMVADEVAQQADYVPLSPHRCDDDSQPAIVALPVPAPYSTGWPLKPSAKAIERSLPDAVGAFIAWIIDPANGWTVTEHRADGSDERVAIEPRHIAVLFRRFVAYGADVTRRYVDAIEARGIPHLLVGGKAFHGREEVETIRAALAAIEWPDDELSVFATLKGSLFAIDDEQLLEFRHRFGRFHPFRIPGELGGNSGEEQRPTGEPIEQLAAIAEALRLLQQLHRGRNHRPVAETVGRLLTATRAHVGLVLRPAGEQALANVLHIAELARQYEAAAGISFRGFIEELRSAAASTEAAEAPILEEGSEGVRLMTVHKAKGLEFPIVILADLTCRISRDEASRHLDAGRRLCAVKIAGWAPHDLRDHEAEETARDRAEGVRLAYVAATRARDLLVVPALGDTPWDGGWFGPLNRALYPPMATRRNPLRGPRCPAFRSRDSVAVRPNEETAGSSTVCPGFHAFAEEGYGVAWWDPGALALGAAPPFGVRREELIVKDVRHDIVAEGRSRYDRWRLRREDARAEGSTPSLVVETAHEWMAREGALPALAVQPNEISLVRVDEGQPSEASGEGRLDRPAPANRPGGPAFGLLVHAVLARSSFDAQRATLADIAAVEGQLFGAREDEAGAAAAVAERVLAHELLVRARQAAARGACRRETPVTLTMPDGRLVEGVVDLAFEEDGRWIVVDYKTDRELAALGEDRYRRQIALYASAIAQATGRPASGILMRI